eukprot:Pgem_evm1s8088
MKFFIFSSLSFVAFSQQAIECVYNPNSSIKNHNDTSCEELCLDDNNDPIYSQGDCEFLAQNIELVPELVPCWCHSLNDRPIPPPSVAKCLNNPAANQPDFTDSQCDTICFDSEGLPTKHINCDFEAETISDVPQNVTCYCPVFEEIQDIVPRPNKTSATYETPGIPPSEPPNPYATEEKEVNVVAIATGVTAGVVGMIGVGAAVAYVLYKKKEGGGRGLPSNRPRAQSVQHKEFDVNPNFEGNFDGGVPSNFAGAA